MHTLCNIYSYKHSSGIKMASGTLLSSVILLFAITLDKGECISETVTRWNDNLVETWSISILNNTEYCYEDECTIRIMESNVLLNIINITDDWIVATNDTNLFTVPNNSVNHCSPGDSLDDPNVNHFIIFMMISSVIITSGSLNIIMHLVVIELRSTPGFIIIGICGTIIIMYITIIITAVFQYLHRVSGNTAICTVFKYMIIYFITIYIMLKITYLFHFTYLMYQTYKSCPYPEMNKKFSYIYVAVIATVSTICTVLIIDADQL